MDSEESTNRKILSLNILPIQTPNNNLILNIKPSGECTKSPGLITLNVIRPNNVILTKSVVRSTRQKYDLNLFLERAKINSWRQIRLQQDNS